MLRFPTCSGRPGYAHGLNILHPEERYMGFRRLTVMIKKRHCPKWNDGAGGNFHSVGVKAARPRTDGATRFIIHIVDRYLQHLIPTGEIQYLYKGNHASSYL